MTETCKTVLSLLTDHHNWEVDDDNYYGVTWKHTNGLKITIGINHVALVFDTYMKITGLIHYKPTWWERRKVTRAIDKMQAEKLLDQQLKDLENRA